MSGRRTYSPKPLTRPSCRLQEIGHSQHLLQINHCLSNGNHMCHSHHYATGTEAVCLLYLDWLSFLSCFFLVGTLLSPLFVVGRASRLPPKQHSHRFLQALVRSKHLTVSTSAS